MITNVRITRPTGAEPISPKCERQIVDAIRETHFSPGWHHLNFFGFLVTFRIVPHQPEVN